MRVEINNSNTGIERNSRKKLATMDLDAELSMNDLIKDFGLLTQEVWHVALDNIQVEDREYIRACLRNNIKISHTPKIQLSTIHSVKGGEADNVVLLPDMSQRAYTGYQNAADSEHRVFYVGVTRARKSLTLIYPSTSKYYSF